jgi:hypothetical protein
MKAMSGLVGTLLLAAVRVPSNATAVTLTIVSGFFTATRVAR